MGLHSTLLVPEDTEHKREELLFSSIKSRLDSEYEQTNNLDNRAMTLIGTVVLVFGIMFSISTFKLPDYLPSELVPIFYMISAVPLISSILFSMLAFRIERRMVMKVERQLFEESSALDYNALLRRMGLQMVQMADFAASINNRKAIFLSVGWVSFVVGLLVLFLFFVLSQTYSQ